MKSELIYVINLLQNRRENPITIAPFALEELSLRELTHISRTMTAEAKGELR